MALEGKRILLGVCGSVAAYKACELARELLHAGASVQCVLTPHAVRFVTPLVFSALTGQPCLVDDFAAASEDVYAHLNLTRGIDAFVVAPLSAETLAQFAQGGAANLLCACFLSNTAPVVLAPAMNLRMWQHPAVQANAALLRQRGAVIVGPGRGALACGDEGEGRLAAGSEILTAVEVACGRSGPPGPLAGRRVLVSAGGTREYLDPVRFITNASSGTLALETCRALLALGAAVELVHTGIALDPALAQALAAVQEARTAFDLQAALQKAFVNADALVMLAAVADYGPSSYEPTKHKKNGSAWKLELAETADILSALGQQRRPGQLLAGVSLEDQDWLARGQEKARRKGMDFCLAVELGADLPFGPRRLNCALVTPGAVLAGPDLVDKPLAASWLAGALAGRLAEQAAPANNLESTCSAREA